MQATFDSEKNKKALLYTLIICGVLLLLAFIITFPVMKVTPPISLAQDLMEINLGNNDEGFGEKQPLIKGEMNTNAAPQPAPRQVNNSQAAAEQNEANPDDNAEADAAPVVKNIKPVKNPTPVVTPATKPVKTTNPAPQTVVTPKPPKPIATYKGPGNGKGNGATEDNGYKYQGNKTGGTGDAGGPSGKPDSYGNTPGGKSGGGLRVSKGDRSITNRYIFSGDLPKATINAIIRVSPDGKGTYIGRDKGSTSPDSRYTTAIIGYLPNIKFNPSDHESTVTVPFNFSIQ